ncbi:MAG: UDP-N-acetylmuramate--L-alanine ligase [Oscillospiraceae bacterium]|jgi:UDP-N-acetylmuramate--alanine ligase|nr:UDP-N-acetylmuramate--L-alanine ligase [Oscillospiraceae bacterium]
MVIFMVPGNFESYIKAGGRCHLVGIGGVSMSPLAEVLRGMGLRVSGSDVCGGRTIEKLRSLGIAVSIGHSAANVDGADFVIRTAAARDDNAEITAARERGIPVFERSQAWGHIMKGYREAVCVAGTHGKTTTTSMITHILMAAGADPTVMIGGTLPILGSGYRVGRGDVIVLESCEYYDSFLNFFPTVAVIVNIDADHLDYFHNLENVKKSFRNFAAIVPQRGAIVCCSDDENTMDALKPLGRELFTFGTGAEARLRGVNVRLDGKTSSTDVLLDGERLCRLTLGVPGAHNVHNALAAAAAATALKLPPEAITRGLQSFTGAGRRLEYKGSVNGADIYDDYAHHPNELRVVLDAVSRFGYKRVILAFQPHTFTRTKALFDDFVTQLGRADALFLAEIYAAREKNTVGISSKDLADKIDGAEFFPDLAGLRERIAGTASPGDVVLTVGAGDIYKVGEELAAGGA